MNIRLIRTAMTFAAFGFALNVVALPGLWRNIGSVGRLIWITLLIMSIWSIAIMVDRYLTFSAARNQSREFAPNVASLLMNRKIDEAISLSGKYKKSHLATVVNAGLQEFRARQLSSELSAEVVEASKRALQRATAIKIAEFRRRLSGLAMIGRTAPFVGLFGMVFGTINAFTGMAESQPPAISAVYSGITRAFVPVVVGLAVGAPAIKLFNYFTSKVVDNFVVEMDNFSAELIDFSLNQRNPLFMLRTDH